MDGFQVTTLEEALPYADIIITATGNRDIVSVDHMLMMKHQAILGNIGHFDNEIDIAGLANLPGVRRENIKPQVDKWIMPNGRAIILLSEDDFSISATRRTPELRDEQLLHEPNHGPN